MTARNSLIFIKIIAEIYDLERRFKEADRSLHALIEKNYLDISINLSPIFFHRRANDSIFLHLEWKGPRASWKLFINVDRHIIIEQVNYKVLSLPPPPPAVDSNSKWNLADWITLTQLLNVNSHWFDRTPAQQVKAKLKPVVV